MSVHAQTSVRVFEKKPDQLDLILFMSKVSFLVHVHIITFKLFDLSSCPDQKLLSTFSEHTFPLLMVEWFFHACVS